jgi:PII-like signaling protein
MEATSGIMLKIYIGESDKHGNRPLYEHLVRLAKDSGIAGATVWRGLEGFGAHNTVHSNKILDISTNLPIVVEFIDERQKIEAFLPLLDGNLQEGLVTTQEVSLRWYRKN